MRYSFAAMVWESLGAINVEGEEVLRQIFSFAAKRLHREFSSFCGRSWAQFSCCLQRSVSQSILMRIDGQEFRTPLAAVKSVIQPRSTSLVSAPVQSVTLSSASLVCLNTATVIERKERGAGSY